MWKILNQGAKIFVVLFNRIIEEGAAPASWATSTMVPIWKGKGDMSKYSNYNPIRLQYHTIKIFERVIDTRLSKIVSITPNQYGFVKGSRTMDANHATQLLLEKHCEKIKPVHMASLTWKRPSTTSHTNSFGTLYDPTMSQKSTSSGFNYWCH